MLKVAALFLSLFVAMPVQAELRGHGGAVRALAVSPDGRLAMSGSFDQSAILWSLDEGVALAVLRFHDGAVNAAAALPDGRFATGGEDGRIALWRVGQVTPEQVIEGHHGAIVDIEISPDGAILASASWDRTARLTPLGGGKPIILSGHRSNVNAVAFLPDGSAVTASYDTTVRVWPKDGGQPAIHQLPTPLNGVAAAPDGEIVAAGADATVWILNRDGTVRASVPADSTPIIALALSPDGASIAAASVAGSVAIIDRASARTRFRLVGPGLPVWSLAFKPDGTELLTGGSDRIVRRWSMATGEHIGAVVMSRPEDTVVMFKGDRGAEVFRACEACHTLTSEGSNRAGPTLHGIFGRRIATAPGYNFSPALKKLDIVWNAETIAKLFEIGPSHYTPGTKMPDQTIANAQDREALVRFLEKATR